MKTEYLLWYHKGEILLYPYSSYRKCPLLAGEHIWDSDWPDDKMEIELIN